MMRNESLKNELLRNGEMKHWQMTYWEMKSWKMKNVKWKMTNENERLKYGKMKNDLLRSCSQPRLRACSEGGLWQPQGLCRPQEQSELGKAL